VDRPVRQGLCLVGVTLRDDTAPARHLHSRRLHRELYGLKVIGTSKQFKNKLKLYLQSAVVSNYS